MTDPIKVAIIEDQPAIRNGLGFLIGSTDGYEYSGGYGSMEEALRRLGNGNEYERPNVVLLDIGLPGMSGIEGARKLKERWPELPLLAFTVYDDDARIFDALCAGASGYLLKKTPPAKIIESLKEAAFGGGPMSPEIASRVINLFRQVRPAEHAEHHLTPHEVRILKLLVEGHSYKTAAVALSSSVNTIGFHMQNIYRKLQVHSKSEAVVKALRDGIV